MSSNRPSRPTRSLPPTPTPEDGGVISGDLLGGNTVTDVTTASPTSLSPPPVHSIAVQSPSSESAASSTLKPPRPPIPSTLQVKNSSSASMASSQSAPPSTTLFSSSEDYMSLTPLRAHYLKKTLVDLQFSRELVTISTPPLDPSQSTLSYLGPPFTAPPKSQPSEDLPFLRFMFRQFILTFPFLSSAPADFFPGKLQPFVSAILARNTNNAGALLDNEGDEMEQATRRKMLEKLEKHLSLVLGASTKLTEKEEVVRLNQKDLDRLEELARKRREKARGRRDAFEVNIVCVRAIVTKGRVRSKVHEEFVIRTRRGDFPDIFVSRRYGDFRTLSDELRKAHPEESVRPPPQKDRSAVASQSPASPAFRGLYTSKAQDSDESLPNGSPGVSSFADNSPLSREKNRLTLRAYLHALLSSPTLASSPVLRSFLTAGPTKLSAEEVDDAKRREEADQVREEGRRTFAKEIASRVEGLREAMKEVKGDLMASDGLTRIFGTIKTTADARDLPADYQSVLAWGRVSLAATIFQMFVASDTSSETLAGLKRMHGMMPYFVLKGILRISNPLSMIRGVLELFLAQPFGGRSLLQRMFSSSLTEEVKGLQEDIEAVREKIGDETMCEKIRLFVDAPPEIQSIYKEDAAAEKLNLIAVILRSSEEPALNRVQFQRVVRASHAHAAYTRHRNSLDDSDDDNGPQDENGWLFEDLGVLIKLYARLRNREQMLALIFEGSTAELLKDIITIFYSPLAQVYKAASVADSLGDLQNFLNDLIRTVEAVEELSQSDPHRTVQTFIDLVQRHEQAFYSFVHRVQSKGEGLFDNLMKWIELFLTLMREGVGDPISLEFILPHTGHERAVILKEVDEVARYHYRLKIAHEEKIRRRFKSPNDDVDGAEDAVARDLVDGVVRDLSFGELVRGDVDEIEAAESSSEEEDSESESDDSEDEDGSDSEEGTGPGSSDESATPKRQGTDSTERAGNGSAVLSNSRSEGIGNGAARKPTRSVTISAAQPRRDLVQQPASHTPPKLITRASTIHATPAKASAGNPTSKGAAAHALSSSPERLPASRRKKAVPIGIEPPELTHIPSLVPLFVEMIRPLLRPRSL